MGMNTRTHQAFISLTYDRLLCVSATQSASLQALKFFYGSGPKHGVTHFSAIPRTTIRDCHDELTAFFQIVENTHLMLQR
jgi:hypothetical protein